MNKEKIVGSILSIYYGEMSALESLAQAGLWYF